MLVERRGLCTNNIWVLMCKGTNFKNYVIVVNFQQHTTSYVIAHEIHTTCITFHGIFYFWKLF